MAHIYNVVTNPNGTFTIEDLQQICSLDGQAVQIVVEDGSNVSQPIVAYSATDNEPTLFSQAINIGTHVATAQLDARSGVYIIKTSDPHVQPSFFSKTESNNSQIESSNEEIGDQINICYAQSQSNWLGNNAESYELVIKKDPSPVKNLPVSISRNQQPTLTPIASPNVAVQSGSDKKSTRLVPLNKRLAVGGASVGILKNTLQGVSAQATRIGKMRRISNAASSPNVTVTGRPKGSTGGVTVGQLLTTPRGPQVRPPIRPETSQRSSLNVSRSIGPVHASEQLGHLSERIRQTTLRQRQLNNERQVQKQLQPVMAVAPTPRLAQTPQKQRAMGQTLGLTTTGVVNRQQQQQLQQQQQQLQQQHLQRQAATVGSQHHCRQVQTSTATTVDDADELMEVDSSENNDLLEGQNQSNNSRSGSEENSSESVAYVQQEIDDPHTAIVQQQITGNEAKMLVILENGEQRLITFEVPKEDCTVQDLLEQVANIVSPHEPRVSLVSDPALGINYIVDVTKSTPYEEEKPTENVSTEMRTVSTAGQVKTTIKNNSNSPQGMAVANSLGPPKYITGMLAVCPYCGMSAADFNSCPRCKRKMPENVKAIPISSGATAKKDSSALPVEGFYKKNESNSQKCERETTAKRGRGCRGRTVTRVTRQVKEPECLTISSDEEDDNRKNKRPDDTKEIPNSQNLSNTDEFETLLDKEPIVTSTTASVIKLKKAENQSGVDPPTNSLSTYVNCRTVRIGSYKYLPSESVQLTSSGLKLEVPLLEDDKNFISVDVKLEDLIKVLVHFSKTMPVLFFYPDVATGLRIRDVLGMQDPKGPYFDPASKDHTHRMITLLPERISDESKAILKEIYEPIFEELNLKEANEILMRATPKSKTQVQTPVKKSATSNSANSNGEIQTIIVYPPPPAKGGIAINTEDYVCLAEDQFLNDVIIDFYLKYLMLEILPRFDHDRTHVFSSYFYKRLTSPHTQATGNTENLSAAARRHARVQKWTKNVNIFEKDFIVIPINEHAHWFLAIICFPGLVGKVTPKVDTKPLSQKLSEKKKKNEKISPNAVDKVTITPVNTITIDPNDDGSERDEAEGDDDEIESDSDDEDESEGKISTQQSEKTSIQTKQDEKEINKVPCILIFDSLAGASRVRVVATLRDYLSCEYKAKMGVDKIFSKDTIKGACPKVPQQSNFTDCGLYVLQYVESFFKNPILEFTLPIKTLKNWFEEIVVTRKREEIANLLIKLANDTKRKKSITLPNLVFPTQDGKLKQKPESQSEIKTSKTETEDKRKVTEPESNLAEVTSSSEKTENNHEVSNQTINTMDTSFSVEKESTSPNKPTTETLSFLKTKRIPRLQKSSDNSEDKQVAKKRKGDSFDSCK